ncbi:MAG: PDDEXK nuclease domain-containing protein, partial [Eubacterium sp.]|nr:PDDEXK nuclease domain-containing protein [Eubacterium sp.]
MFYIWKTIEEGLSRNALIDYIKSDLYHRTGTAITNFAEGLPGIQGEIAQEIVKDTYDLNFITLQRGYNEEDLEAALEQNITNFLLELGTGFAFVGRQKEIIVSGKTRRIDMLFYHIGLKCYVVVELKAVSFEPEFAGKLNFYVNAVDEIIKTEKENPTIGLLICRDKDQTEVQWAFRGIQTPIG